MKLISPGFKHNELIPKKFTCQGQNVNPPLLIENIPPGTQTLALIVDDPDAPVACWVHWIVFNILPTKEIAEDSVPGMQGYNDFGKLAYGGPCPPSGTHRYFFKLYALDVKLNVRQKTTKKELEEAMQGHIIGRAQLIGLYRKQ